MDSLRIRFYLPSDFKTRPEATKVNDEWTFCMIEGHSHYLYTDSHGTCIEVDGGVRGVHVPPNVPKMARDRVLIRQVSFKDSALQLGIYDPQGYASDNVLNGAYGEVCLEMLEDEPEGALQSMGSQRYFDTIWPTRQATVITVYGTRGDAFLLYNEIRDGKRAPTGVIAKPQKVQAKLAPSAPIVEVTPEGKLGPTSAGYWR